MGKELRVLLCRQLPHVWGLGLWPMMPEAWQGQGVLVGALRAPAALQPPSIGDLLPAQCHQPLPTAMPGLSLQTRPILLATAAALKEQVIYQSLGGTPCDHS